MNEEIAGIAESVRCCMRYVAPTPSQEHLSASSPLGRLSTPRPPSAEGLGGIARLLRLPGGALTESSNDKPHQVDFRHKEAIGKETDFSYAELVEERPEHSVQLKENIVPSRIQE